MYIAIVHSHVTCLMRNLIYSTVKEEPKVQYHHEMPPFHIHSKLQLLYLSVQQSQRSIIVMQWRVYNVEFKCRAQHTSEIAAVDSFAFEELYSHDRSRVSKLRHNLRTKLRIKFPMF